MSEKKKKPAALVINSAQAADSPDGGGIIAVDTTSREYVPERKEGEMGEGGRDQLQNTCFN